MNLDVLCNSTLQLLHVYYEHTFQSLTSFQVVCYLPDLSHRNVMYVLREDLNLVFRRRSERKPVSPVTLK